MPFVLLKKPVAGGGQLVCVGFASNPQISAVHWRNLAREADKEAGFFGCYLASEGACGKGREDGRSKLSVGKQGASARRLEKEMAGLEELDPAARMRHR
jgi:hypothetical protein